MYSSFIPPRQVKIGDAAAFVGTTPRAIRHYHEIGLLSDFVTERLKSLPEDSLRQTDLDTLLVTERIFGPLGAAVQATRFIAPATHPDLREDSDRVDAAEEALDDTIAVDDPREDETGRSSGRRQDSMSAFDATGKMPYAFSPARLHGTLGSQPAP